MVNPELKGKFEVTEKVKNPKFVHVLWGKIDLATINVHLAEKLVTSGHLRKVSAKKAKEESKD